MSLGQPFGANEWPVPEGSPTSLSRIQMDFTYRFNSGLGWTEKSEFLSAKVRPHMTAHVILGPVRRASPPIGF